MELQGQTMKNPKYLTVSFLLLLSACGGHSSKSEPESGILSCSNLSESPEGICVEADASDVASLRTQCGYLKLTIESKPCDRSLAVRGCRVEVEDDLTNLSSLAVLDSWYASNNPESCSGQTLTLTDEPLPH